MTAEIARCRTHHTPRHASLLRGVARPRVLPNFSPSSNGGRGGCRVLDAPAAWCAHGESSENAHQYSQRKHWKHPASPRDGFTASFALFPGTIGLVDPAGPLQQRLAARLGSAPFHLNLDADHGAPEPRDVSVRNTAARLARRTRSRVSLALRSPHTTSSRPHSPPRVRDDRDTPLAGGQDGQGDSIYSENRKQNIRRFATRRSRPHKI